MVAVHARETVNDTVKLQLPDAVRLLFSDHPIFGPNWRKVLVDFDQWTICSKIIVKTHTMPIGFYFERSTSTHRPPQTSSKTSSNGEVFLKPLSMDRFETFSHVR